MRIRQELLKQHSRDNSDRIEEMVLNDEALLIELMICFLSEEVAVAQRAAMVVGNVGRTDESILKPWWNDISDSIARPTHQANRRNGVRYFSELTLPLPIKLERKLVKTCLEIACDPQEKTASAVFAMQFVADRAERFPKEASQLVDFLEDYLYEGSKGFQNRARKILAKLQ